MCQMKQNKTSFTYKIQDLIIKFRKIRHNLTNKNRDKNVEWDYYKEDKEKNQDKDKKTEWDYYKEDKEKNQDKDKVMMRIYLSSTFDLL